MSRILSKAIMGTIVTLTLFHNHQGKIEAHCAKCERIEAERAREQAKNPQKIGYYDELISMHDPKDKSSPFFEENSVPNDTSPLPNSLKEKEYENEINLKESKPSRLNSPDNAFRNGTQPFNSAKSYSTLFSIIGAKDLLSTLNGSYTIFIPDDDALRQLSPKFLNDLAKPENANKLSTLVSNHIVNKKLLRQDFTTYKNLEIKALSGRNLTLEDRNGKLFIDNIQILRSEPAGNDGVIYVINKVLN